MWPFKSIKSLKASGILEGITDWHSHILPGVDDGIQTLDKSLEVLNAYEELGIRKVWFTPHIMEDYPNTVDELKLKFEEVRTAWKGKVEIALAAENMMDSLFEKRLEEANLLPIGKDGNHLLVETSYYTPPYGMDDMLEKIRKRGYFTILAHPERYRYMTEKDYESLKDRGILFQANLMSVVGNYGETAQKKLEWLLSKGMIDLVGTDIHRLSTVLSALEQSPKKTRILDNLLSVVQNVKIK